MIIILILVTGKKKYFKVLVSTPAANILVLFNNTTVPIGSLFSICSALSKGTVYHWPMESLLVHLCLLCLTIKSDSLFI